MEYAFETNIAKVPAEKKMNALIVRRVEHAFDIITQLKRDHGMDDQSVIWLLESMELLTSVPSDESRKFIWTLLRRVADIDESDHWLFDNKNNPD
jgi:hypothetical protein